MVDQRLVGRKRKYTRANCIGARLSPSKRPRLATASGKGQSQAERLADGVKAGLERGGSRPLVSVTLRAIRVYEGGGAKRPARRGGRPPSGALPAGGSCDVLGRSAGRTDSRSGIVKVIMARWLVARKLQCWPAPGLRIRIHRADRRSTGFTVGAVNVICRCGCSSADCTATAASTDPDCQLQLRARDE